MIRPTPPGCVPRVAHPVVACAFQPSTSPPGSLLREQSAFHPNSQIPIAAYLAADSAHKNNAPVRITPRALLRELTIRWHQILQAAPATNTSHLPGASIASHPAYASATPGPTPPAE